MSHEARVVAAVRNRRASRGADRTHRGGSLGRRPAHDPRERRGHFRVRAHGDLEAPQPDGSRLGAAPMNTTMLTYLALALPYLVAIGRVGLALGAWTRWGIR